jgi:glycerol-3-phosphate acyltransferase PlsY
MTYDLSSLFFSSAFSYLLGSIPFGLILTHLLGYGDIRKEGSGNIGATNALRVGGLSLGVLTLLFDILKGFGAVLLVRKYSFLTGAHGGPELEFLSAYSAVVGHVFPLWLKFKGGKGVATALGVMTALSPSLGLFVFLTWLLVAYCTGYSSLSSLISAALSPFYAYYLIGLEGALALCAITLLILYRHGENIKRLLSQTEPKIGSGSKPSSLSS